MPKNVRTTLVPRPYLDRTSTVLLSYLNRRGQNGENLKNRTFLISHIFDIEAGSGGALCCSILTLDTSDALVLHGLAVGDVHGAHTPILLNNDAHSQQSKGSQEEQSDYYEGFEHN